MLIFSVSFQLPGTYMPVLHVHEWSNWSFTPHLGAMPASCCSTMKVQFWFTPKPSVPQFRFRFCWTLSHSQYVHFDQLEYTVLWFVSCIHCAPRCPASPQQLGNVNESFDFGHRTGVVASLLPVAIHFCYIAPHPQSSPSWTLRFVQCSAFLPEWSSNCSQWRVQTILLRVMSTHSSPFSNVHPSTQTSFWWIKTLLVSSPALIKIVSSGLGSCS